MVASYVAGQVWRRPAIFLRRWYVDASERFWAMTIEKSAAIDRVFAIKIMFRTITQPLYGDYSVIGRIIGPIFRASRILIALPIFAAYFAAAFALWTAWLAIPPYLILRAVGLL
jgi:hypothetical protein